MTKHRRPIVFASLAVAYAIACGSSDKKRPPDEADGSPGGTMAAGGNDADASVPDGGMGPTGGSGGTPGGSGGTPAGGSGGSSGTPKDGGVPDASGGSPPVGGVWEFSVELGAQGVAASDVANQTNAEGSVYRTAGGPSHVEGTNAQHITPADLGILDTDDVDGISYDHGFTLGEVLFSVQDVAGDEGAPNSSVRDQSDLAEVPGDVFQTFGAGSISLCIPGPCPPNDNSLVSDDVANGLQPLTLGGTPLDNLNALEQVGHSPPIYFTVAASAVGPSGSALNGTPANERGCTIFQSPLDGTHSVFLSCDDIGLVADDEVDALHASTAAGTNIVFSVSPASVGKTGSAVNDLAIVPSPRGAHLFGSTGAGTNTTAHTPDQLGLEDDDDVDAVHLFDGYPDKLTRNKSCVLPIQDPACNVYDIQACAPIGADSLICYGQDNAGSTDYGFCFIDLAACAYVASSYFMSPGTNYPGLLPDGGGQAFYSHSFVLSSPVDMTQAPSGTPEVIHIFSTPGFGPGQEDFYFFRFSPTSGTTGPYQVAFLDLLAPMTYLSAFAPRPLANGDLVAIGLEEPADGGPVVPFVHRITIDWSGGTASLTKLGQAPPPCRYGQVATFVDARVDGIDVTSGEYACQMDQTLALLEPARRWTTRDTLDPTPLFYTIEPGFFGVDVSNDAFTNMESTFIVYTP